MPPKKKPKSVATPAKPRPNQAQNRSGRHTIVTTNGNKFAVVQYIPFPPLSEPRTYQAVGDGASRVNHGFLTLKVPQAQYPLIVETCPRRAVTSTADNEATVTTDSLQPPDLEGDLWEGRDNPAAQNDSAIDVDTPPDNHEIFHRPSWLLTNETAEPVQLNSVDHQEDHGRERFDLQAKSAELTGQDKSLSIVQPVNSISAPFVLLERQKQLLTSGVDYTVSPDTPGHSPIPTTEYVQNLTSHPSLRVSRPYPQVQAVAPDSVAISPALAQSIVEDGNLQTPVLQLVQELFERPQDAEVFDKPYAVPVTAHHSFITLNFNSPLREAVVRSSRRATYNSAISLSPTVQHSFITLKLPKSEPRTVCNQSIDSEEDHIRSNDRQRRRRVRGATSANRIVQPHTVPSTEALCRAGPIMAPVNDPNDVSTVIKEVIDTLYDVQSKTHGYIPETQDLLVDRIADLTGVLSHLRDLTDPRVSPNNPIHNVRVPPEIVDYVDDGRNPDIFTRDFVENVQRGNAVINGKKQAFKDFSVIFAKKLKEGISGIDQHVDRIMEQAGLEKELQDAMKQTTNTDTR